MLHFHRWHLGEIRGNPWDDPLWHITLTLTYESHMDKQPGLTWCPKTGTVQI